MPRPGLYKGARLAGAYLLAVGALGLFPPSISFLPALRVDSSQLSDSIMTLEEIRGQDAVPESTAR